jgi:Uncharacterised protein family (UPF0172)
VGEDQALSHSIPRFDSEMSSQKYEHLFATASDSGDAPRSARSVLPKQAYTLPPLPVFSSSSRFPIDRYRVAVAFPGRNPDPGPSPRRAVFHGMASPNFRLEDLAYGKLILHAFKYPQQTVNGVLIGSTPPSCPVVIEDAVPLQHHWTNLNPIMMEVGLGMVRSALLPSYPVSFLSYIN